MDEYDLVIIGSGPGGYVAAIKAAQLGMKTAIIESREVGGTCLNRGCIPTKTLIHSSHLYHEAMNFEELGIHFDGLNFDMNQLQNHKEEVVIKIRQGISSLLQANGVTIIPATATILADNQVLLRNSQDFESLVKAKKILIATGSKPVIPNLEGVNLDNVITSDELLTRRTLYKKLLIIGGGVIGIEFASIYSDLGCEVEIIEAMERITPNMDKEISQSIAMSLKKKGVLIHTKSKVIRMLEGVNHELICEYEEKDSRKTTVAEGVLLAVGRRANTEGLFAPELSPELDGANIRVNEKYETNINGIYAIGDVIKGKQLAHAASAQGIAAVMFMCGQAPTVNLKLIPSCIYTNPEIAIVGMNEEEALNNGFSVTIGKYPMLANSKTILSKGERGFIKVICDATTDKILGAQLLCDRATDIISEFTTAIANGLTSKDLAAVIRPHPTYSEGVSEAVEDVHGMSIHLLPKRR